MTRPSVAIVYDKFLVRGGGERVCEMLIEAFPDATLYALNARPRAFWEARLGRPIVSPVLGGLFASRGLVTMLYPLAALLMATLNIKADIIIAYSSTCGKYARLHCHQSILYSNYPNRGLYQPKKMIRRRWLRLLMTPVMKLMIGLERHEVLKYDRKISISETSRRAMLEFAGVDSEVLMPPFDEQGMTGAGDDTHEGESGFFVVVSRLEPEKELEYVIDAFRGSRRRLHVIGTGSLLSQFSRIEAGNIAFLGYVDDQTLARHLRDATALIFPSDIEYSLVPLEATSLGTPVIAFDSTAMREVLIDIEEDAPGANAVFYGDRSAVALSKAIDRFDAVEWDVAAIKRGATAFGRPAFIKKIRDLVLSDRIAN